MRAHGKDAQSTQPGRRSRQGNGAVVAAWILWRWTNRRHGGRGCQAARSRCAITRPTWVKAFSISSASLRRGRWIFPRNRCRSLCPTPRLRLAFMGVNSQRTTIQLGTAVYNACENLKQEMIQTAAKLKGGKSGRMDRRARACLPCRAEFFLR